MTTDFTNDTNRSQTVSQLYIFNLTVHCSMFNAHCSLFTVHCSLVNGQGSWRMVEGLGLRV